SEGRSSFRLSRHWFCNDATRPDVARVTPKRVALDDLGPTRLFPRSERLCRASRPPFEPDIIRVRLRTSSTLPQISPGHQLPGAPVDEGLRQSRDSLTFPAGRQFHPKGWESPTSHHVAWV